MQLFEWNSPFIYSNNSEESAGYLNANEDQENAVLGYNLNGLNQKFLLMGELDSIE